ncbi:Zinc/iron permease [Obelidium mucronatum]|nr:Zinc/iron permease [Obelidium mucronatum]
MSLGVHAKTPVFAKVLQILKMFGIGVIAATAWIHLLPDAFIAFSSPCLPEAWKPYGPAYVGLFGMIAAFLVQFIELAAALFMLTQTQFLQLNYAQQSALGAVEDADCDCTDLERVIVTGNSAAFLPTSSSAATFGDTESLNGSIDDCECTDLDRVVVTGNSAAFLSSARNSIVANLSKEASSGLPSSERNRVSQGIRVIPPASIPKPPGPPGHTQLPLIQESPAAALPYTATGSQDLMSFFDAVPSAHSGRTPGTDHNSEHDHHDENERDNELGTILLECGILFHSLIIGVTLGVSSDVAFRSLIVAVCFHQMFEGLALGVLIGNLNLSNDGRVVLAQGVFNSLSAGILFYNTYTELMSAEVSHSGHFHGFSPYFKAACFVAMYSGAALMALLAVFE